MDLIEINSRDLSMLGRGEQLLERGRRHGLRNAVLTDVKDRALEGQVLEFGKAFAKNDKVYVFMAGCFDAHRKKPVGFQVQHLASSQVASTDGALELFVDTERVTFRLDLAKTKSGAMIGRLCESGSRNAMSIGATFEDVREEVIAGHKVNVVYKARLDEISICREGAAGDQAFAYLVDKTVVPKPIAGRTSATMRAHHSLHMIDRKVRCLKQRIAAMADTEPYRSTVRSISVHVTNHWQTEETERLQALALRRLHR